MHTHLHIGVAYKSVLGGYMSIMKVFFIVT